MRQLSHFSMFCWLTVPNLVLRRVHLLISQALNLTPKPHHAESDYSEGLGMTTFPGCPGCSHPKVLHQKK